MRSAQGARKLLARMRRAFFLLLQSDFHCLSTQSSACTWRSVYVLPEAVYNKVPITIVRYFETVQCHCSAALPVLPRTVRAVSSTHLGLASSLGQRPESPPAAGAQGRAHVGWMLPLPAQPQLGPVSSSLARQSCAHGEQQPGGARLGRTQSQGLAESFRLTWAAIAFSVCHSRGVLGKTSMSWSSVTLLLFMELFIRLSSCCS